MSVWKILYCLCFLGCWNITLLVFAYFLACAISVIRILLQAVFLRAYQMREPSCLLSWGEAVQNVNLHYSESYQQGSSKFPYYLNRNDERARVLERGSTLGIGWCLPSWGGCWQSQVSHRDWASKGIWADRMSALHSARATWQSLTRVFEVTVFIRITSWMFSAISLDDVFFENRTWEPSGGPFNNHQTFLFRKVLSPLKAQEALLGSAVLANSWLFAPLYFLLPEMSLWKVFLAQVGNLLKRNSHFSGYQTKQQPYGFLWRFILLKR